MKTRFDGKIWVMAYGVAIEVKEMETAHLLNTVKLSGPLSLTPRCGRPPARGTPASCPSAT